jgi:ribosomal protein S6--L-glutamate ligase
MILSFHPCFDTDVQIILGDRRVDEDDRGLIKRAEAVLLPLGCSEELYEACRGCGGHVFPAYEKRFSYPGKTGQSLLFEDFGLPHPETLRWGSVGQFRDAYSGSGDLPHPFPFIIKDDRSHEAEGVFMIEGERSLERALGQLELRERSGTPGFITQVYVPAGGIALRAVILGKRIRSYWKRPQDEGQLITTISRNARIDHDWRPGLQEKGRAMAGRLAEKTGINLAAVDFVFDMVNENSGPFFLEINYFFGRRGLGGTERFYELLYEAVRQWLEESGLDPDRVSLV